MTDEAARGIAQVDAAREAFRATGCTIDAMLSSRRPGGITVQLWHCGMRGPIGIAIDDGLAPDAVATAVWQAMTYGNPHPETD